MAVKPTLKQMRNWSRGRSAKRLRATAAHIYAVWGAEHYAERLERALRSQGRRAPLRTDQRELRADARPRLNSNPTARLTISDCIANFCRTLTKRFRKVAFGRFNGPARRSN